MRGARLSQKLLNFAYGGAIVAVSLLVIPTRADIDLEIGSELVIVLDVERFRVRVRGPTNLKSRTRVVFLNRNGLLDTSTVVTAPVGPTVKPIAARLAAGMAWAR
jgi:hypothetical protein